MNPEEWAAFLRQLQGLMLSGGRRPEDEAAPRPMPADQATMLRRILPREATPSPALDRAYDAIRRRFPDADRIHLQEDSWYDPTLGRGTMAGVKNPPMGNVMTVNPKESALASDPRLETMVRHEQRHVEQMQGLTPEQGERAVAREAQFDYGRGPLESDAWKAEADYYQQRGFTPQDMQFTDPAMVKAIPGIPKDYDPIWTPRPFDPHWVPPTEAQQYAQLAEQSRAGLGRMMHNTALSPVLQRVVPRIEQLQTRPGPDTYWTTKPRPPSPVNIGEMGMQEREKAYPFEDQDRPLIANQMGDWETGQLQVHPGVPALFEEGEVEAYLRNKFSPSGPNRVRMREILDMFRAEEAIRHHFGQQGGVMPTVKNAFPW